MRRVRARVFLTLSLVLWAGQLISAESGNDAGAPDFQEVYGLLRDHLAGITESNLNRTAVEALVSAFSPRVALIRGDDAPVELTGGPLVKSSNVYDGTILSVRISRVEEGLAKALREACQSMGTNRLNGIVLDLRYAGGNSYSAAAETADLFIARERPLIDWGKGIVRSTEKRDALSMPVAVLVNGRTAGAAEALAAVLRDTGTALILGSNTAGQAMVTQEYPLKNGQRLRIATASIQVGESVLLSSKGVKPDIPVEVNPEDELAYFADPYKELLDTNFVIAVTPESRTRRNRFNEAELVRERQNGFMVDLDSADSGRDTEPRKPIVRDPTLARALDLLKGLAVVRRSRS